MTPTPTGPVSNPAIEGGETEESPVEDMGNIARKAEKRAQELVTKARKANTEAEKALGELAGSPLMVNGLGKAVKEAHGTASAQDERLQGLLRRIHEHFNPTSGEGE